jgi:hypothetical protein
MGGLWKHGLVMCDASIPFDQRKYEGFVTSEIARAAENEKGVTLRSICPAGKKALPQR